MASSATHLQVEVVTRTERLWHGVATSVSVPAIEGELGILVNRAPILAVLREGRGRIAVEGGDPVAFHTSGGFVSVDSNFVTIVCESAEIVAGS